MLSAVMLTAATILSGCPAVAACPASAKGMKSQEGLLRRNPCQLALLQRGNWAVRPGEETLLGDGLGAESARCLLASDP